MRTYYNGQSVALTWAIDALTRAWQMQGHDTDELSALLSRAIRGGVDCSDSADARETLCDIIPGLEVLPA
jgi:hypothetical protein